MAASQSDLIAKLLSRHVSKVDQAAAHAADSATAGLMRHYGVLDSERFAAELQRALHDGVQRAAHAATGGASKDIAAFLEQTTGAAIHDQLAKLRELLLAFDGDTGPVAAYLATVNSSTKADAFDSLCSTLFVLKHEIAKLGERIEQLGAG